MQADPDPSNWERHDLQGQYKLKGASRGNVMYSTDRKPTKPWGRERMLSDAEAQSIPMLELPTGGRLLRRLENIRNLAAAGNNSALFLPGGGSVSIYKQRDLDMEAQFSDEVTLFYPIDVRPVENRHESLPPAFHCLMNMPKGGEDILVATDCPPGYIRPARAHEAWKAIISDYGQRHLFKPEDILDAIAAFARTYYSQYSTALGTFQAGLWSHFITSGLLWRVKPPHHKPPQYRAPSWSWASVDGTYFFNPDANIEGGVDHRPFDIEVIEYETTTHSESPQLGSDTSGHLVLIGKTIRAFWGPDASPDAKDARESRNLITPWLVFTSEEDSEVLGGSDANAFPDHTEVALDKRELVEVLLVRRFVKGIGHNMDHTAEMLILKHDGEREDHYVRVGYSRVSFKDFYKDWAARLVEKAITIF